VTPQSLLEATQWTAFWRAVAVRIAARNGGAVREYKNMRANQDPSQAVRQVVSRYISVVKLPLACSRTAPHPP
jgi:hypothetical protein